MSKNKENINYTYIHTYTYIFVSIILTHAHTRARMRTRISQDDSKLVVATKCPFRADFWSDAYCPPHYRSTLGGRAAERACDAMPQERSHIRNMTESPFRHISDIETIIETLNCLYY